MFFFSQLFSLKYHSTKMTSELRRLAVVIGNSNYTYMTNVPNAIQNAKAIQETLCSLGFDVTLGINQEKDEILQRFTEILDTWRDEASEIVVYFTGHGISIDERIYLGPIDAKLDIDFIDESFLNIERILKVLLKHRKSNKHPIIFVIDCCHSMLNTDNAHIYDQDPLRGISENDEKKSNIAILYSTTDDYVALNPDSSYGLSLYTRLLLENMIKDYTIDQIQSAIAKFLDHSNQVPWIYHCLYEPYKFYRMEPSTIPLESSLVLRIPKDPTKKRFHGVPHRNNDYINRPDIMAEIEASLNKNDEGNILALRGLGGMGKSQLMLQYCYLHRSTYEFIFWLEVGDFVVALESFFNLAINLGLDERSAKEKREEKKIIEWVCDWLEKRKGWLLLLNNADDTVVTKLFEILPRIGGNIILTTREHVSSKIAKIITIDKMTEDEALSLLLGAEIDSIDHDSARYLNAKKIVAELDSMALAINLARAYVESMTITFKEYLNMFKNERDILFSLQDDDNYHHYHHSLKTVWQVSINRIRTQSPLSAEILDICAFFQPGLIPVNLLKRQCSILMVTSHSSSSPTSSEADWKATQEAIALLAKFSFVTRTSNEKEDPTSDVLKIHRLVQKVIYDAMRDEQKIRLAHSIASAFNNEIDFSDPYSQLTRTMMNAYLLHIRHFASTLDISHKALLSEDLLKLLTQTVLYLLDNGVYSNVEELAQLALSISTSIHESESYSIVSSLNCLARVYCDQGNYVKAKPLYDRALVISVKGLGPEHKKTVTSLNSLADLYSNQGNYVKARQLYEQALAICEMALEPEHPKTAKSENL